MAWRSDARLGMADSSNFIRGCTVHGYASMRMGTVVRAYT
jgi:hypothetical protein